MFPAPPVIKTFIRLTHLSTKTTIAYPAARRKFAADIGVEQPIRSYNCSVSRNNLAKILC